MVAKRITAAELLHQLESDPEWVAARDAQERQRAQREAEDRADEAGLVNEVRSVGYDIGSVWDLVNNTPHPFLERRFLGPYDRAYPILVRHLGLPHIRPVREGIVRALTVKDGGPLVEDALLNAFHRETNHEMRWVLANALRVAMPYSRRRKHPAIAETWKGKRRTD